MPPKKSNLQKRKSSDTAARKNRALAVGMENIGSSIYLLRGQRVMLDSDLAALYGVSTKRFNEAVKRNREKFPEDFMFSIDNQEIERLRSQIATSNTGRGGRRYTPYAFTEHGALMAASILNSPRAVEVSVYVVRAFVRMRELLVSQKDLDKRIDVLEGKTVALEHFSDETRKHLKKVFEALRAFTAPPNLPKRSIGFIRPLDKTSKRSAEKAKRSS